MNEIPYRLYYPVKEVAQLRGCTEQYVRDMIRKGRYSNPPAGAIAPALVQVLGQRLTVHRSYVYPGEPGPNVSQIRTATVTQEQIEDAMVNAIRRLVSDGFSDQQKRSA